MFHIFPLVTKQTAYGYQRLEVFTGIFFISVEYGYHLLQLCCSGRRLCVFSRLRLIKCFSHHCNNNNDTDDNDGDDYDIHPPSPTIENRLKGPTLKRFG